MNLIPLLLADPSPSLRLLVLRELLQRPENDPEVQEIKQLQTEDPLIHNLLILQNEDGSWDRAKIRYSTYADKINVTSIV
jgi:hypothetical protein